MLARLRPHSPTLSSPSIARAALATGHCVVAAAVCQPLAGTFGVGSAGLKSDCCRRQAEPAEPKGFFYFF
eukprot:gene11230-biopygen16846